MTTIYELSKTLMAVPQDVVQVLTFAGGEPHANVLRPELIAGRRFVLDARVDAFNVLGQALVIHDALRRSGATTVKLFCPYLPGARQDRGAPFTAKVYADLINASAFDQVVGVDPHSAVMPTLLDRFVAIDAPAALDPRILEGEKVILICPDAGAVKRTGLVAAQFGLPVAYARKHRNPQTGELSGFSCDPIDADAIAVVVDDICDGGGTFLGLAHAVRRPRELMRLWTAHGIYAKGLDALRASYSVIGCTDSFPSEHAPDLVLPVLPVATPSLLSGASR